MSCAKRVNAEDDESSDEDEDFSASEDEWNPTANESDSEENDDDDFEPDITARSAKLKSSLKTPLSSRRNSLNKSKTISSLRNQNIKKLKPSSKPLSRNISKILQSSQFKKKKSITSSQNSDSSGDDHLVDPKEIDLKSSFFDVVKNNSNRDENVPNFDCNAGMQLTDSEDDEEMCAVLPPTSSFQFKNDKDVIKQNSKAQVDFHKLINYNKNAKEAEDKMKKLKSTVHKKDEDVNVLNLLALGEGSGQSESHQCKKKKSISTNRRNNTAVGSDSESDWEHVQDHIPTPLESIVEGVLQINIPLPQIVAQKKKGESDIEMMIRRKLNRNIKEQQIYLHKISLLCHIAHGMYCNRVLNSPELMEAALKLLPNKTCYPDGQTCIQYFESISKWYKLAVPIRKNQMYLGTMRRPKMGVSLALQIKYKEALCKKDFVMIFIILLRAMGMQCRLVINLVPSSFKPPSSELHTIKVTSDPKVEKKTKNKDDINHSKVKEEKKETQNKITSDKRVTKKDDSKETTHKVSQRMPISATNRNNENIKTKDEDKKNSLKKISQKKPTNTSQLNNKNIKITDEDKAITNKVGHSKETRTKEKEKIKKIKSRTDIEKKELRIESDGDGSEIDTKTTRKRLRRRGLPDAEVAKTIDVKSNRNIAENLQDGLIPKKPAISSKKKFTKNSKIKTNAVTVENNHFKEIIKNLPAKRIKLNSSNQQGSSAPSTSKKQEETQSIYVQLPTKRSTRSSSKLKQLASDNIKIPQLDGSTDTNANLKKLKLKSLNRSSNSDDDFAPSPPKRIRPGKQKQSTSTATNKKLKDNRVLSTDTEGEEKANKKKMDIWVEVYSEKEEKWVAINLFKGEVDKVDNIRKSATTPISYVFAWNNNNTLKDVSPRYCPQWNTATRKLRVDKEWLEIAISEYFGRRTERSKAEDVEFHRMHLDKPLPSTISEYKNHPLYALQRHLLKFEAIYPADALTLGFVRGEPVYARECVKTLHSREIWLKSARVVRPAEQPYKIVKARPKWDKYTSSVIKDLPLEIFGYWQTMEYDPPTAKNGIVPRNAYGNVDLFKPTMLPKKTVHLHLPGLNRVCKKLKIDCAPAVTGFDFHQGSCHPVIDGYIVCEEFAELVTDAWTRDQEDAERREDEKYYQRVFGNWKKLIRGLLIRERLKTKYNFQGLKPEDNSKKKKRKII